MEKMPKQSRRPIDFVNPDLGTRLGVFDVLDANVKVMPSGCPNLTEVC